MSHSEENKECPQNNCGQFANCNNYACEGEHGCTCQQRNECRQCELEGNTGLCDRKECKNFSQPTSDFSKFWRTASPEEKAKVFEDVAKKANEDQKAVMETQPTSDWIEKIKEIMKREYLRGFIDYRDKSLILKNGYTIKDLDKFYDQYHGDNPDALTDLLSFADSLKKKV